MARYTPERRMAGMASSAPIGTATSPPASTASGQGNPAPTAWAAVEAPTAAKAMWHSETWPDVRTSRPSEAKRMT